MNTVLGSRIGSALLGALVILLPSAAALAAPPGDGIAIHETPASAHDVSPPLRDMQAAPASGTPREHPNRPVPHPGSGGTDSVVQSQPGTAAAPALGAGFEGVGQGFSGPQGTFSVNSAPPDPNLAVGPNHVFQLVNTGFAIFNKASTGVLYGPAPTNTLWSGFGGGCQVNNDGDAIVTYDQMADRFVVTQFSVSSANLFGYLQCVAVSTSPDPTGTYYRYSFPQNSFPDYPKLSVWPDAYYITFNLFSGNRFAGGEACAYNRTPMLAGGSASQQCGILGTSWPSLLPSEVDGSTPPPAGSPDYLVNFGTNALNLFQFHVDWSNPANSKITGPATVGVASFSTACGGGSCVPQSGTSQLLDSLADRLMYRFAYRNFGDHESLVVDHSVAAGGSSGVRWYELRNPQSPSVYQQGTYAPDSSWRWMGAVAMDHMGDIAAGFSVSSAALNPGIHYTAHLVSDPPGIMGQGEGVLIDGTGSQTGGLNRWGDYTDMRVDPSDDCTFWYTNQYQSVNGSFDWHTRVGSFKLSACSTTPDFSLSVSPASQSVVQGQSTSYTVSVTGSNGFAGAVSLSASGLPAGASASFNPASVTGSGNSTLTVTTGSASPSPGTYPFTVSGTSGSLSHQASATLVVTAPPQPDFSLSVSPASQSVVEGQSTSYTVSVTGSNGFAGAVSLSASGLPAGASASFNPASVTGSGNSTLTVTTGSASPSPGTYPFTVSGTSGSLSHQASATLVVTAPPQPDFSLSVSPGSQSVIQGQTASYTVSVTGSNGFAGNVSLSLTGAPSGSTVSFNPPNPAAGSTSTLTVTVPAGTPRGSYTLTITGTSGSLTHATSATLRVTKH